MKRPYLCGFQAILISDISELVENLKLTFAITPSYGTAEGDGNVISFAGICSESNVMDTVANSRYSMLPSIVTNRQTEMLASDRSLLTLDERSRDRIIRKLSSGEVDDRTKFYSIPSHSCQDVLMKVLYTTKSVESQKSEENLMPIK